MAHPYSGMGRQLARRFQCRAPLFLPRGSVVSMRYHYDNSAGNPRNPNSPPKRVRSGNQSTDEMGHLWLQVLPRGAGDQRPALQEALLRHRIEKYPDDGSAHLGLGTLLLSRKDIAGAIRHLRLAPESAQAHNNLGAALKIEGQLDAAAEAFRRALQIQPGYANARFNLGTTFAAQGPPEEAAAEFRHVLAAIPQDREARDQLTAILVGIGDAAAYRELVALEPQNADYRNNLGILLVRTGNIAGAIEQFEAALQVNPNHAAARRNLDQISTTKPAVMYLNARRFGSFRLVVRYARELLRKANLAMQHAEACLLPWLWILWISVSLARGTTLKNPHIS